MARSIPALENVRADGSKPTLGPRASGEPMFEVSTITQRRKSTRRPCRSVSRPSSKTCRNRSQIGCAAFSNSSSRTTENGSLRTEETRAAPRCSCVVSESSRSSDSGVWYSLMSRRTSRSADPKRNAASDFAISVLPVPVGPTKRKTPSGRVGSVRPALIIAIRSTTRVHGLRLLEDAALEERAHLIERERGLGIEQGEREAGPGRERREHVGAVEALGPLLGRLGCGRVQESEEVPWRRDPGQELLRELEGFRERLVVRRDRRARPARVHASRRRSSPPRRAGERARPRRRSRRAAARHTRSSTAVGVASASERDRPGLDMRAGARRAAPEGSACAGRRRASPGAPGSTQTTSCPATDSTRFFTRPSSSPM